MGDLKKQMCNLVLGDGETISQYVARANCIRFDIESAGLEYDEADMCEYLLHGLPDEYECVKMYMYCHRDLLKDVETVESWLIERESQINRGVGMRGNNVVNTVSGPMINGGSAGASGSGYGGVSAGASGSGYGSGSGGNKGGVSKSGVKKSGKGVNKKKYVCYFCGKPGHIAKYCWAKKKAYRKAKNQGNGNKSSGPVANNTGNNSNKNSNKH